MPDLRSNVAPRFSLKDVPSVDSGYEGDRERRNVVLFREAKSYWKGQDGVMKRFAKRSCIVDDA